MELQSIDVGSWNSTQVIEWLKGLQDDVSWMNEVLILNNIDGKQLLMITGHDLCLIGANKVDLQEHILEAVERLRSYNATITNETLQRTILRLAVQSRSLQKQLVANRCSSNEYTLTNSKFTTPTKEPARRDSNPKIQKQRVELDTLACVSVIVKTVRDITDIINKQPFTKYDDYRSMKSLILALSIEMTSTAQRDQFVERPNDILEKSSKALADYCDRIVLGTKDFLLIQPFLLKLVKLRKNSKENDFGLTIKSLPSCKHIIDKITPLSLAKKTNELTEGDEIIFFNQYVTGWSERNIQGLLDNSKNLNEITLIVKKNPVE